jgi:Acyl-CoA dehydrogenase, C-terminal domain
VQMAIGEAAAAIDGATTLLHSGRDYSTAEVLSGRKITEAEALRARRDMVYAQHQVSWALDRLCELDGARWVYDSDELGAIRRDVMTILTHHAASRQAAMAPYCASCLQRRNAQFEPVQCELYMRGFARRRRAEGLEKAKIRIEGNRAR